MDDKNKPTPEPSAEATASGAANETPAYATSTLLDVIVEARGGDPLSEADQYLVHVVSLVMQHLGSKGVGRTFVAGALEKADEVLMFEQEAHFQRWLEHTKAVDLDRVFALAPLESRVVIIFAEGVFCAPMINQSVLN